MVVSREPENFPCHSCNCDAVGRDPYGETWSVAGVLEKSPICPARLINDRSRFFLKLHRHYRNGVLPVAGGLLDQPYIYVRAMDIIERFPASG